MSQVKTRRVKLKTIMYSRAFMRGYKDAKNGLPYCPEYDSWRGSDQWNYERGRHYSILTNGAIPPKNGKNINLEALLNFGELMFDGAII